MNKLSLILVAGLFACVLAVVFRDDSLYQIAYDNLHDRRLYFGDSDDEEEGKKC